jgi:predicted CXXCH cytochrome family protein
MKTCFLTVAALFLLFAGSSPAQERSAYTTAKACADCHEDIAQGWKKTPHASAYESLKKSSQENLPGCFKCHVTGYERESGFIDGELTPELTGVQCEECHGAGRAHIASGGDKKTILRSGGRELCIRCHTPGQDKNFDYQHKVAFVHGGSVVTKAATNVPAGQLVVEPMNKDFGVIDEGINAQMVATLTNMGATTVNVTNVRTN